MVADYHGRMGMLPVTTNTSDKLFSCINIDDFERPWTFKIRGFIDICDIRLQRTLQEWFATKWLEIDWQFSNRNCYRLLHVSWALAQIFLHTGTELLHTRYSIRHLGDNMFHFKKCHQLLCEYCRNSKFKSEASECGIFSESPSYHWTLCFWLFWWIFDLMRATTQPAWDWDQSQGHCVQDQDANSILKSCCWHCQKQHNVVSIFLSLSVFDRF